MEFNAVPPYASNPFELSAQDVALTYMRYAAATEHNQNTSTDEQPRHAGQTMGHYGSGPPQHHTQGMPQPSRSSPPMNMWAMSQAYPYGVMPKQHMGKQEHDMVTTAALEAQLYPSSLPTSMSTPTIPEYSTTDHSNSQLNTWSSELKNSWDQKQCGDLDIPNFGTDFQDIRRSFFGNDEDFPIIDLRFSSGQDKNDSRPGALIGRPRGPSDSSLSMASSNYLPEVSTYEDLPALDKPTYTSTESEPWPKMESGPHLSSPMVSPKVHAEQRDEQKAGSRVKASPSSYSAHNSRSSPYTLDSTRHKRWSAPTSTPSGSRAISQLPDRFASYGHRMNMHSPHQSMPSFPFNHAASLQHQTQNILYSHPTHVQSGKPNLFPQGLERQLPMDVPRPLPSQGLFRLLQSNGDRHAGCSSHFADLSDPPDLYSTLHEEPSNPPESDMNPSDPNMTEHERAALTPHEQDLRFDGDLYTPRWVRGHGNKREGWCGLCKPGRWLVLKNSAFWYDKSFTHGVSAATGAAFHGPQDTRRTEGNPDVWEGLCGSCAEWIPLVSSKKKGTTWFRHAYRCHTHAKVKDGPKRRRETTQQMRARAISSASSASSNGGNQNAATATSLPTPPHPQPQSQQRHHQRANSQTVTTPSLSTPLRSTPLMPASHPPTPRTPAHYAHHQQHHLPPTTSSYDPLMPPYPDCTSQAQPQSHLQSPMQMHHAHDSNGVLTGLGLNHLPDMNYSGLKNMGPLEGLPSLI